MIQIFPLLSRDYLNYFKSKLNSDGICPIERKIVEKCFFIEIDTFGLNRFSMCHFYDIYFNNKFELVLELRN